MKSWTKTVATGQGREHEGKGQRSPRGLGSWHCEATMSTLDGLRSDCYLRGRKNPSCGADAPPGSQIIAGQECGVLTCCWQWNLFFFGNCSDLTAYHEMDVLKRAYQLVLQYVRSYPLIYYGDTKIRFVLQFDMEVFTHSPFISIINSIKQTNDTIWPGDILESPSSITETQLSPLLCDLWPGAETIAYVLVFTIYSCIT